MIIKRERVVRAAAAFVLTIAAAFIWIAAIEAPVPMVVNIAANVFWWPVYYLYLPFVPESLAEGAMFEAAVLWTVIPLIITFAYLYLALTLAQGAARFARALRQTPFSLFRISWALFLCC